MSDDALRPLISTIRRTYYTIRKREPIAAVLDTMDALGFETRFGQRPVLSHYHQTETGWSLMFTLPPGIASKEIRDKADHFSEQTGGVVTIRSIGRTLQMDVCMTPLPKMVPYTSPDGGGSLPLYLGKSATGQVVIDLARLRTLCGRGRRAGQDKCATGYRGGCTPSRGAGLHNRPQGAGLRRVRASHSHG